MYLRLSFEPNLNLRVKSEEDLLHTGLALTVVDVDLKSWFI